MSINIHLSFRQFPYIKSNLISCSNTSTWLNSQYSYGMNNAHALLRASTHVELNRTLRVHKTVGRRYILLKSSCMVGKRNFKEKFIVMFIGVASLRQMRLLPTQFLVTLMGSATGGPGGPWPPKEWRGGQ